ncbi:hypothetical protein ACOKM5_42800 [Streptomyces sp. BH097]|uniref:hypothetical protein n=1 Tax=unclassified Streptomyces TaxID=2593676 RepID=UPI003BB694B5
MWDALDAPERGQVAAMLVWEADRLTTGNDIYLVGTSGHQLYMTRTDGTVVSPATARPRRTTGAPPRSPSPP